MNRLLSHASLCLGSSPSRAFPVLAFQGRESLSSPFAFDLRFLAAAPLGKGTELMKGPATLRFQGERGPERLFQGCLARLEGLGACSQGWVYGVRLVPRLWRLGLDRRTRVFAGKPLPRIVEMCLAEAGLEGHARFLLREPQPEREFTCQLQETTLDFLSRLLEGEGISYRFSQEEDGERWVLTDSPGLETGGLRIPFLSSVSGGSPAGLWSFAPFQEAAPGRVDLQGFDLSAPGRSWKGGAGDGKGVWAHWEESAASPGTLARRAMLRAQAQEARARTCQGAGDVTALEAGGRFCLEGHERRELDGDYRVLEVLHEGSPAREDEGEGGGLRYSNRIRALPATQDFRPVCATPRPFAGGGLVAIVDGEGEGPQLDPGNGGGRYRLRFPMEAAEGPRREVSAWVPLLQPTGGTVQGMHLPLRPGTPVLVLFVDGDPDRPVIAGALPDLEHPSAVQAEAAQTCALLPAEGHALLMAEGGGNPFTISSNGDLEGQAGASLDFHTRDGLELESQGERVRLEAEKGIRIRAQGLQSAMHGHVEWGMGCAQSGVLGQAFRAQLGHWHQVNLGTSLDLGHAPSRIAWGGDLDIALGNQVESRQEDFVAHSEHTLIQAGDWKVQALADPSPLADPVFEQAVAQAVGLLGMQTAGIACGAALPGPLGNVAVGSLAALGVALQAFLWRCRAELADPSGGASIHVRQGEAGAGEILLEAQEPGAFGLTRQILRPNGISMEAHGYRRTQAVGSQLAEILNLPGLKDPMGIVASYLSYGEFRKLMGEAGIRPSSQLNTQGDLGLLCRHEITPEGHLLATYRRPVDGVPASLAEPGGARDKDSLIRLRSKEILLEVAPQPGSSLDPKTPNCALRITWPPMAMVESICGPTRLEISEQWVAFHGKGSTISVNDRVVRMDGPMVVFA